MSSLWFGIPLSMMMHMQVHLSCAYIKVNITLIRRGWRGHIVSLQIPITLKHSLSSSQQQDGLMERRMAVRATFKALQKKLHIYTSTGLPYEWNQTMIQEVNTKNAGLTRGVIFICCVSNTPQKICLLGMLSSHHIHTLRIKRRGFMGWIWWHAQGMPKSSEKRSQTNRALN